MIPRSFIDELLQRVDIVGVIERVVPLKKAGKNFVACCPFHSEKTPSFTVSEQKQFYHCFGCGAHGNVIGFLMNYDHLTFVESVQELAAKVGLDVPFTHFVPTENPHHSLTLILEKANQYYQYQLVNHPQSSKVCQYLQRRGLSKAKAEQFGLGFAPPGWDSLLRFFEKGNIPLEDAITAGLLIKKDDGGHYDRFRDRLIFPIRNRKGNVIGFGGRVLNDEEKPKYLNSPETPLFNKGKTLYGLYEARQLLRDANQLLVVEGYMDVITLSEQGIPPVLATLGTGITDQHIEQLIRLVSHVIYCFDADAAGQQAAWRAMNTSLPFLGNGKRISFLILPKGDDPDSLMRSNGGDYFLRLVNNALPLSKFLIRKLADHTNLATLEGKAQFLNETRGYLAKIKDSILVSLCLEEISKIVRLDKSQLQELEKRTPIQTPKEQNLNKKLQKTLEPSLLAPVRLLITLVLQNPSLALGLEKESSIKTLDLPGIPLLMQLTEFIKKTPNLSTQELLEKYTDTENLHILTKFALANCLVPEEGIRAEFRGALECLYSLSQEREMELLLAKSRLKGLDSVEKRHLQELITASKEKKAEKQPLVSS